MAPELGCLEFCKKKKKGKAFQENGTARVKVRHSEGKHGRVLYRAHRGTWWRVAC